MYHTFTFGQTLLMMIITYNCRIVRSLKKYMTVHKILGSHAKQYVVGSKTMSSLRSAEQEEYDQHGDTLVEASQEHEEFVTAGLTSLPLGTTYLFEVNTAIAKEWCEMQTDFMNTIGEQRGSSSVYALQRYPNDGQCGRLRGRCRSRQGTKDEDEGVNTAATSDHRSHSHCGITRRIITFLVLGPMKPRNALKAHSRTSSPSNYWKLIYEKI
jgi:hypothetical protein